MTIWRGTGGGGNATTDSEIALLTQLEQSASSSASAASVSAAAALVSENNAETAETNAAASEVAAAASASAASTSATNAASSASSASTSAANAASSASAASTSETNAASSASAAATSASNAATSESNAAASASAASTSATNAASSASAASTSATNAANSASAAATSETNAANSASAAAASASNAATSEANAAASAAAAATFDPANFVDLVNNQTIGGTKTFSNTVSGSISGNAGTATTATNIAGGATGNIPMQTATGTTSFYTGQLAGMRNKIINGSFRVWQRGTSGISIGGSNTYTADRWFAIAAGANITASKVDYYGGNASALSIDGATSNTLCDIGQRIEGLNTEDLAGKVVTLSCEVYRTDSGNVTWEARYANSVNDFSATTLISSGTIAVSGGNWASATVNFTVPVGFAHHGIEIRFKYGALVATKQAGLRRVQLEVGEVATPFEHRPYGAELALCQRYYATGDTRMTTYQAASSGFEYTHPFPVQMRAAPTMTFSGATYINASGLASNLTTTSSFSPASTATALGAVRFAASWTAAIEL